jgi:hypothetical protein
MSDKTLKQSLSQVGEAAQILQGKLVGSKFSPMFAGKLYLKILIKRAKNFVGINQY